MGLREVERIPPGAEHVPDQDQTLPNGTRIKQFRLKLDGGGDQVYEQFILADGHKRQYVLSPERR